LQGASRHRLDGAETTLGLVLEIGRKRPVLQGLSVWIGERKAEDELLLLMPSSRSSSRAYGGAGLQISDFKRVQGEDLVTFLRVQDHHLHNAISMHRRGTVFTAQHRIDPPPAEYGTAGVEEQHRLALAHIVVVEPSCPPAATVLLVPASVRPFEATNGASSSFGRL
jgi:hypothetical protein